MNVQKTMYQPQPNPGMDNLDVIAFALKVKQLAREMGIGVEAVLYSLSLEFGKGEPTVNATKLALDLAYFAWGANYICGAPIYEVEGLRLSRRTF